MVSSTLRPHLTHFTGDWVGPRVGLDRCGKSLPHRDSIPDRPARSHLLYRLNYPAHKISIYIYIYIYIHIYELNTWTVIKTLNFILKALIMWSRVTMGSVMRRPALLPPSMQLAIQDSPRLSKEHVEALVGEISQITKTLINIRQHNYFIIFETLTIKIYVCTAFLVFGT